MYSVAESQATSTRERIAVEIGSEEGHFLCQLAAENPDVRCLGIEIDGSRCRKSMELAASLRLKNVSIQHAEAFLFLRNHFDDETIDEIHIYFPSPYPKVLNQNPDIARKVKGRLIDRLFVGEVERVLVLGGTLRIITDHEAYFNSIVSIMEDSPLISVPWRSPIHTRSKLHLVGTRWERKQRSQGKRIFFLQFIR
jgi:tRNA (guanine-N7-)-methyltransferase